MNWENTNKKLALQVTEELQGMESRDLQGLAGCKHSYFSKSENKLGAAC